MKKIYNFDSWLAEGKTSGLTQKQVTFLDDCTDGVWTYNEGTGLVDITGDFDCQGKRIKTLQGVRFGRVSGNFYCDKNRLTTLEGSPQVVGRHFDCRENQLTTLEGAPREVGWGFGCRNNKLTTLKGAPQEVGGGFDCSKNQLKSLEGAPQKGCGDFDCSGNQLTTLEGAPQKVCGDFDCSGNQLTTLEGAPMKIGVGIQIGDERDSPIIIMNGSDWNLQGWMRIWREGSEEAKALISTLPAFKEVLDEHPEEFEDLSDLQDLGF